MTQPVLTPTHPNAVRIRDLEGRAGNGDFDALQEVYTDDMVVHAGYEGPGGSTRGRQQMLDKNRHMAELSGGTLRGVPLHVVADDRQAIVAFHITARRGERTLDTVLLEVWRLDEHGRMVETWDHFTDADAWRAFWTEDPAGA